MLDDSRGGFVAGIDEYAVDMRQVFDGGVAYVMGEVEPERDWEKSSASKFVQKTDPGSGLRVWTVVIADPGSASQRKIKILCDDEPVVPEPAPGMPPFVPVEFVGLTVRPWLDDRGCKPVPGRRCGCRVELSIRARGVRPAGAGRPSPVAKGAERSDAA
jgi:hypothetical protein